MDTLLELAGKNNLDGIEWIMRSSGQQPDCKSLPRITNVHTAFYTPVFFRSFFSLKNIVRLVGESADFAASVGADKLVVHPFPAFFNKKGVKELMRNVLIDIQKKYKIDILLENLEKRFIVGSLGIEPYCIMNYEELYHFAADNSFYLNLDTAHCATKNIAPADFFEKYHKRIKGIHVSNFKNGCHRPLDEGSINFEAFFALLRKYGYSCTLTLELNREKAETVERNINLIKHYLKSR